jgi:hypothetical protein
MSRRSSILDDLCAVGARLPWQATIGLAILSFILLHIAAAHLAVAPAPKSISDLSTIVQRGWFHTIATIFQFVVPAALLM